MSAKVYEIVTAKILESLEKGCIPWRRPWKTSGGYFGGSMGGSGFVPVNHKTGRAYRGINVWMLNGTALAAGYQFNRWLSYKQCADMGGQVRKDEKGTVAVFWKILKVTETSPTGKKEEKKIPLLRYHTVFNIGQCDGLKMPTVETPAPVVVPEPSPAPSGAAIVAEAEAIIEGWKEGPTVSHTGGNRAFYRPATDSIHLPARDAFTTSAGYYETVFHELGHSTGHASRLKRPGIVNHEGFGSHSYGREELVAEMTAAFLCGVSGLEMDALDNATSYIKHWMEAIKEDARAVVMAASQAQKAADMIQNIKYEVEVKEEKEKVAA